MTSPTANGHVEEMETPTSADQLDRASILALIDKARMAGYERFRTMDTRNTEIDAEMRALQQRADALQKEKTEKNAEWGKWELLNRAHIDGLLEAMGEKER